MSAPLVLLDRAGEGTEMVVGGIDLTLALI